MNENLFDLQSEEVVDKTILTKVLIENYRNIKSLEITPSEHGFILEGKNGVGKTNVLEAILWAITDKIMSGVSKSELQGITPTNSDKGITTNVELTFNDNYIFKKTYYEKYNADGDLTSRETVYTINGGVVKKNSQALSNLYEYLELKEVMNSFEKTKLLSEIDVPTLIYNTNYLKTIDYKNLRALIIEITGEISPQSIINGNDAYKKLVEPLRTSNGDLEALKEKLRTEKFGNSRSNYGGLQYEIQSLNSLIDEFNKKADDTVDITEIEKAKKELKVLDDEIFEKENALKQDSNELVKDIETKIVKAENELLKERQALNLQYDKELSNHNNKLNTSEIDKVATDLAVAKDKKTTLQDTYYKQRNVLSHKESLLDSAKLELEKVKNQINDFREQWQSVKNPKNVETITCPHCDKPFALHESKEHAIIIENKLSDINVYGKRARLRHDELVESVKTYEKELETAKQDLKDIETANETLTKEIETLATKHKELYKTIENHNNLAPKRILTNSVIETLTEKINSLNLEKIGVQSNNAELSIKMRNEIDLLKAKRQPLLDIIDSETASVRYKKDAQDYIVKRDNFIKQLNDVEQLMHLIKNVEREMLTETENRVSKAFGENVKFELFKINITNGSIDNRVCNMLVKDIHGNFVNINHINTGDYPRVALDFINSVKKHYGIRKSFVLVDELQSLDNAHQEQLLGLGEQIIATRVGLSQPKLEIIRIP
ncbi:hypothetical protein [Methanoculleus sp.]|uniref:hypothetical protein n=1 Tax=Methanoculleus sp. TaxID=90427 RepID=UPI0025D08A39|nr:hypothetical protein [Methanoculleus sp.]MCK9319552.1 hypothetical protein [Methanoculleus sp.]